MGAIKKDRKPAPDAAARGGDAASDFLKTFSGTSFDVLVRQAGTSRPDLAERVQRIKEEQDVELMEQEQEPELEQLAAQ